MLNFTVGPVMSDSAVLKITAESVPYFRTPEFSEIMLENEKLMLSFLDAPENSRCIFLTTSGTGAMESCVMNVLNENDKVLVINGGSFGQRFEELCVLHELDHAVVRCDFGTQVTAEQLSEFDGKGFTALLVNMDETSSGVLYDMELLSSFCKRNGMLLIVDAISAFITDPISMKALDAAVVITGSQKALAVQPGIAVVALAPKALERVENNKEKVLYLSLKNALKNMERGQTPFTPAVATLLQIHTRLKGIEAAGGIEAERKKICELTNTFRSAIQDLPFEFVVSDPKDRSNAVTALRPTTCGAKKIVQVLKDEYQIWICPNGGDKADAVFRVGHIGYITMQDLNTLLDAFNDLKKRGII